MHTRSNGNNWYYYLRKSFFLENYMGKERDVSFFYSPCFPNFFGTFLTRTTVRTESREF